MQRAEVALRIKDGLMDGDPVDHGAGVTGTVMASVDVAGTEFMMYGHVVTTKSVA